MKFSHSKEDSYASCPKKYKLRYIDRLKVIPNFEANNPLIVGNAMHLGIETTRDNMINHYYSQFPVINDNHINEGIKLEYWLEQVTEVTKDFNILHQEYVIDTPDFKGIVDLITQNPDQSVNLWDYKYSKSIDRYKKSAQLHIYKYFLEQEGFKVKKLGYILIPKTFIRQKKTESLYEFRNRLKETIESQEIKIQYIRYDPNKVVEFFRSCLEISNATEFPKKESKLCDWCDYKNYCLKGDDLMILPKNERRNIKKVEKKVIWFYGAPFCGKTTLANAFPDPLMLNTDGNIKFIDAPYIPIKDVVTVEGRLTHKKLAWKVLEETINELEKKQNDFKTIVLDLLEDAYEHCRVFMYDKLQIEHESDNSFKAWDMVRTKFLSTLRRLMNLDYDNIILISHEDSSKDITKKSGDKITSIRPSIQEKVANKVAGMVDIVARIVADDKIRTIDFKTSEVIFGGGRLTVENTSIPLDYDSLMKVYDEVNSKTSSKPLKENSTRSRRKKVDANSTTETPTEVLKPDKVTIEEPEKTIVIDAEVKEESTESAKPTEPEKPTERKPKRTRRSRKNKEDK